MSARAAPPAGDRLERATAGDVVRAGLFVVLLAPLAGRAAHGAFGEAHVATVAAAVLLGVLGADFVTGFLHWLCDTFFAEDTPIIGPALIGPFREHHRDPLAMTRRTFLRVSDSNVIATSAVLVVVWVLRALGSAPPSVFADVWLTSLACGLMLTNQVHKWAHLPQVPRPVAWLQRAGLILSPKRHGRHHASPDGRAFCVTTGWLNPVIDRAGIFTGLERLAAFVKRLFVPGAAA